MMLLKFSNWGEKEKEVRMLLYGEAEKVSGLIFLTLMGYVLAIFAFGKQEGLEMADIWWNCAIGVPLSAIAHLLSSIQARGTLDLRFKKAHRREDMIVGVSLFLALMSALWATQEVFDYISVFAGRVFWGASALAGLIFFVHIELTIRDIFRETREQIEKEKSE